MNVYKYTYKKLAKGFLSGIAFATLALSMPSCMDDDEPYTMEDVMITIATVVPIGESTYYLRLDNGDTLWPSNTLYPDYIPQEGQRVMVSFIFATDSGDNQPNGYSYYIEINAIHDILTKDIAPDLGEDNDSIYGTDPVTIADSDYIWIGDGYLNVYFETYWGGQTPHYINLIQPDAENDPYALEFRHNAYDDPEEFSSSGRVAFDLSSLPDTQGETVKLKVKVIETSGEVVYTLDYNSDKTITTNTTFGYEEYNDIFNITDLN